MNNLDALLCIGGEGPQRHWIEPYLGGIKYFVAADSGLLLANEIGIKPDLVVGDMDSLPDRSLLIGISPDKVRIYPEDKDETDAEIGIRVIREKGWKNFLMLGGGEGRLDHLIALLSLYQGDFYPKLWITAREFVETVSGSLEFSARIGQKISFFPLDDEVAIANSEGLKWPLTGLNWDRCRFGISNMVISKKVVIQVRKGRLLMVKLLKEES